MRSHSIYLDYAATTPIDERVAQKMMRYMTFDGIFANPASRSHGYGWQAEGAVETARIQISEAINADSREIVFTSGATESDNLAIKGIAHAYHDRGKHIITSQIEHKAVLDTCKQLEQEGFEITYLQPEKHTGIITSAQVTAALRDDTILVTLMAVNNELGSITDVAAIGNITRAAGVIFHVDGAQAIGKITIDMESMNIDLMSMSAHKAYGPKGMGALYVRLTPHVTLSAQQHGGGHERGMRSGTLATHQIVGMGKAFELATIEFDTNYQHITTLRNKLWDGIQKIDGIQLNGSIENGVPHIMNISFAHVTSDDLMRELIDLSVSSGSACTSVSVEPSYVLTAIGLPSSLALGAIRFSFGHYTTEANIDTAIDKVTTAVNTLRG